MSENKGGIKMFRMIRKNLKNQYTKQTLLALLMLVNIAVTALVICFAYGIYYDFAIKADSGMAEYNSKWLSICAPIGDVSHTLELDQKDGWDTTEYYTDENVTAPQLVDFIRTMPDELRQDLDWFDVSVTAMSSLHYHNTSTADYAENTGTGSGPINIVPDDLSDNDEPYYGIFHFRYNFKDDKIIPYETTATDDIPVFTDDECNNGTDFIYVNKNRISDDEEKNVEPNQPSVMRNIPEGTETAVIGGKEYKITYFPRKGHNRGSDDIQIPLTSFSDEAILVGERYRNNDSSRSLLFEEADNDPAQFLDIYFTKPLTRDRFNLLTKHIHEKLGDSYYIPDVTLLEEHEMQML